MSALPHSMTAFGPLLGVSQNPACSCRLMYDALSGAYSTFSLGFIYNEGNYRYSVAQLIAG